MQLPRVNPKTLEAQRDSSVVKQVNVETVGDNINRWGMSRGDEEEVEKNNEYMRKKSKKGYIYMYI